MPGFDNSGPLGQGPKTGRGQGKCGRNKPVRRSQSDQPFGNKPEDSRPLGRGAGNGRGRGRGKVRGLM